MEDRLYELKSGNNNDNYNPNYKESDVNDSQIIIENNDGGLMPEFTAKTDRA